MSTLVEPWCQPAPTRSGLTELHPPGSELWESRLSLDRKRAVENQTASLLEITSAVEARSHELRAAALVLTGSTARNRRTQISDLDYHVIGGRPDTEGLSSEIDLYSDEPDAFLAKLFKGDDFAHWTLRYGCILFDTGVLRQAAAAAIEHDLWPDPERKLRQARRSVEFAQKLATTGDYGAVLEFSRGALSLTARWWLISHDVFPLARDELAEQLVETGQPGLAKSLEGTIHRRPAAAEISSWLSGAWELIQA
ncbi:MAG TPA: hypothetical protein VHP56_08530 [Solirubrobacterales bacterium]|jgi:hypothetical protein|nr:hypothetical protein [Solirubrobacterales bacterium]